MGVSLGVLANQARAVGFLAFLALAAAAPVQAGIPLDLEGQAQSLPEQVPQPDAQAVPLPADAHVEPVDPSTLLPVQGDDVDAAADDARHAARTALAEARRTAENLAPDDPVGFLQHHLKPVRDTAGSVQTTVFPARAEVSDPPAAAATVTEVPLDQPQEGLLVAGATVAAAALAILWLAGSSGSLGAGAAGATGAGKLAATDLKRLLPFASPLFTRFEKDTVLGHPKREALYGLILQSPGVSLQSLCDATGLSRTAVTHHLRLLELQHLIVSKRMGRSRHYYENGGRFGRDQKEALAVLQNPRSKEVAAFVKEHPGAIQKALCQALGLQPSIAHWHLSRLQQAQLVESVRNGRTVSYFPGSAFKATDQPVVPASVLAAPSVA